MLGANIARSGLRGSSRPLTRQPHISNVRTAMYKKDKPDGTSSTLEWNPKTYATVGGILAVCGGYGYMMGKPYKVVGSEKSPAAITEKATSDQKDK